MADSALRPDRRTFLCSIGALAGSAALAPLVSGCEVSEVHSPKPVAGASLEFDVANATYADLATVGKAVSVEVGGVAGVLIRTSQAQVVGLTTTCTHQGCPVNWDAGSGRLACPCHGASFGTDGKVLSKPGDGKSIAPLTTWQVTFDVSNGKGKVQA